jgi:hypothetical protein
MSKIGQFVQELQEGQPEPFEPDPLYDERELNKTLESDPGYDEFNRTLYKTVRRN